MNFNPKKYSTKSSSAEGSIKKRARNRLNLQFSEEMRLRLKRDGSWFPFVGLLSFVMVAVYAGYVLPTANPRTGSPIHPIEQKGTPTANNAIWFTLSKSDPYILATTDDRKTFRWHIETKSVDELKPFKEHLEEQVRMITFMSVISKRVYKRQLMVVIAADRSLLYKHVRPVIYMLAQIGLTHYAFETSRPSS